MQARRPSRCFPGGGGQISLSSHYVPPVHPSPPAVPGHTRARCPFSPRLRPPCRRPTGASIPQSGGWRDHGVGAVLNSFVRRPDPRQFGKLAPHLVAVRRRGPGPQEATLEPSLEDQVLLVAAYWRTNLTLRQLAPLFGVSKSAADRVIDHGPRPSHRWWCRLRKDPPRSRPRSEHTGCTAHPSGRVLLQRPGPGPERPVFRRARPGRGLQRPGSPGPAPHQGRPERGRRRLPGHCRGRPR